MIVWLALCIALTTALGAFAYSSYQQTKAKAEASVARAQEHTKRADGRHELFDLFGKLRRIDKE